MKVKTPNFIIDREHTYIINGTDTRTVPKGSFVVPLELKYVPKHIREQHPHFDKNESTFCFTKYGILTIPTKYIVQI